MNHGPWPAPRAGVTLADPVASTEVLRPGPVVSDPYVAIDPYAASGAPYRAADPYAASADPYAASPPGGGKGGGNDPYAGSGDPERPKRPRRRIVVRHQLVLPPPPFSARKRNWLGWTVPIRALMDTSYDDGCPRVFVPGDGMDFTEEAQYRAEFDHTEREWCPQVEDTEEIGEMEFADDHGHSAWVLPVRPGEGLWSGWDDEIAPMYCSPTGEDLWLEYVEMWAEGRRQLLETPGIALSGSGEAYAFEILKVAGYDMAPGSYTGSGLAVLVLANFDEDPGIRAAFADVILQHDVAMSDPRGCLAGKYEPLTSVSRDLAVIEGQFSDEDGRLLDIACSQFFVFPRLHGDPSQGNGEDITGNYLVTGATYHSLIDEPSATAPIGMLGWREVVMEPADADFDLLP